jgi:tRNA dimethylallyltransferase
MADTTLYILTGPTAVGKTEFSLRWAEKNNAEILSCDSTLFYKGMDLGTAKPTGEELARVPHHGIDLVPVSQQYSIASYLAYAQDVVNDVFSRGKRLLITGGSGFYLKSFFEPVVDDVNISEAIHYEVVSLDEQGGLPCMVARLLELNPDGVGELDLKNPRRVVRALERCLSTGKTVLELRNAFASQQTPFDAHPKQLTLLTRPIEILEKRIRLRARGMIYIGLIDEVKKLLDEGLLANPSAASAIGYRETIQWLRLGRSNRSMLEAAIVRNTLKLVKKQRTWFNTQIRPDQIIDLEEQEVESPELFSVH